MDDISIAMIVFATGCRIAPKQVLSISSPEDTNMFFAVGFQHHNNIQSKPLTTTYPFADLNHLPMTFKIHFQQGKIVFFFRSPRMKVCFVAAPARVLE